MKKLTLMIIILVSTVVNAFAVEQTNESLFQQGSVWSNITYDMSKYTFFRYTLDGDTTINEKVYKKMYEFTSCTYNAKEASYFGAYREDSDRIYCQSSGDWWLPKRNGESVLYDFTLNVGDVFAITDGSNPKVEKVDSVLIGNVKRKRITFEKNLDVWIQGIGSTKRSFHEGYPFTAIPTCFCGSVLNLFNESTGTTVYTNPDVSLSMNAFKEDDCAYNILDGLNWMDGDNDIKVHSQDGYFIFELPSSANQLNLYTFHGTLLRTYLTEGKSTLNTDQFPQGVYVYKVTKLNGSTVGCGKVVVK